MSAAEAVEVPTKAWLEPSQPGKKLCVVFDDGKTVPMELTELIDTGVLQELGPIAEALDMLSGPPSCSFEVESLWKKKDEDDGKTRRVQYCVFQTVPAGAADPAVVAHYVFGLVVQYAEANEMVPWYVGNTKDVLARHFGTTGHVFVETTGTNTRALFARHGRWYRRCHVLSYSMPLNMASVEGTLVSTLRERFGFLINSDTAATDEKCIVYVQLIEKPSHTMLAKYTESTEYQIRKLVDVAAGKLRSAQRAT
eukprot:COSAG02_NODE_13179_length_1431_cov_4.609610_1_plen_253_part_00